MRIVSLVPSSTETLIALGANVIACTKFCEQAGIAHVGGTKNPEVDSIVSLAPDLVVLDKEENRRDDAEALEAAGLELFVSDVVDLASAAQVVSDLSALVGANAVIDQVQEVEPLGLSVFVPIWRRPWMSISAATYGGSLLAHLGCQLVTADAPTAYPEVQLSDVAAASPDVVAVPSEPYAFTDHHVEELRQVFPTSVVVRIDGQDLFWWGSRTPGAVVRMHSVLGPR